MLCFISIQHYFRLSFLSLEILHLFRTNRRLLKKKKKIADENPQNFDIRAIDVVSYDNFLLLLFFVSSFVLLVIYVIRRTKTNAQYARDRQTEPNRTQNNKNYWCIGWQSATATVSCVYVHVYRGYILYVGLLRSLSLSLALQCNCFKLNIYRPKSE